MGYSCIGEGPRSAPNPPPSYILDLTMRFPLLAVLLGACSLASAQEFVVPQGMENTHTGNTTLIWRSTAFRFQMLYDTTHFVGQGLDHPIAIQRLRFRPINGAVDPGGQVYQGVTVQMSSSPSDYDTMSSTFANNVGADVVTVFQGDVTLLPAAGGTPNDYYVDIALTTPFVYNATQGLDLCVDVTAPNAPTASVPNTAASNNRTLHFARRLSSASPGAATGALSDFAAVIRMDYTIPPGTALAAPYGTGCYDHFVSFYETFAAGALDLGGTANVTSNIGLAPNGLAGGYRVNTGNDVWHAPQSPDLMLGDDAISAPLALPFTFPYPGGSTNSIIVESNGNVWLQPPTHASFLVSAGPDSLLTRGPVLSVFYDDMDPSPVGGGSVHFDVDTVNNKAYVTWVGVPIWIASPPPVRPTNTFQVLLSASGVVEMRYREMDTSLSWTSTTIGFSPGIGNLDPGSRDISATMPFSTRTDQRALSLSADVRPTLGQTVNLVVADMPPSAFVSGIVLSLAQFDPGVSLAGIGMPGCFQYVGLDVTLGISFAVPTFSLPLSIPNDPVWIGTHVFGQALTRAVGVNPLGFVSSNGLDITVGN